MQTEDNTKNKTTKFFIFWIVEVQLNLSKVNANRRQYKK